MNVGNNGIGADLNQLDFPSIKGCEAIVYLTDQYLFGLHDMMNASRYYTVNRGFSCFSREVTKQQTGQNAQKQKAAAFARYVHSVSSNHRSHSCALYAVINKGERFTDTPDDGGNDSWEQDIKRVAKALKMRNDTPIYGIRLDKHIKENDSVYVRFLRDNGSTLDEDVTIKYKTQSNMKSVKNDNNNQIQLIRDDYSPKFIQRDAPGDGDVTYLLKSHHGFHEVTPQMVKVF